MKKMIKTLKIFLITVFSLGLLLFLGLYIYTFDSSKAEPLMYEAIESLETNDLMVNEYHDRYLFRVSNPLANIILIPGGKVETEAYLYLAYQFALKGYQVSLSKAWFNLAILNPGASKKFIENEMSNIIIGHSLGGTVGSMVASSFNKVDTLILLGSYTNAKIEDKKVLLITAENDLVLNQKNFDKNLSLLPSDYVRKEIIGGNHAGFGWYGKQKNDGIATISVKDQQDLTISYILDFIK